MDTLIKIKLSYYTYQNQYLKQTFLTINKNQINQTIFEIKESDCVYITFLFDHKTSVYYEDFDGNQIQVHDHKPHLLSSGREDYGAYFVGYFKIMVVSDQPYEFNFLVKPHNLEYESVLNLRNYVDNYYQGLSLDLTNQIDSNHQVVVKGYRYNYRFLIEQLPKVINDIHRYIKLQPQELIKSHQVSRTPKKLTLKSIKWLSKQGLAKNADISNPDMMMIEKVVYNKDTKANQLFKQLVLFFNDEVENNINKVIKYIDDGKKNKKRMMKDVKRLEHKNAQGVNSTISKKLLEVNENKVLRDYQSIAKMNDLLKNYEEELMLLKQANASLEYYIYHSWLNEVSNQNIVINQSIHPCIRNLLNIKNGYLGKNTYRQMENKLFASKSTPKLFETFAFIMLIQVLNDLHFRLDETSLSHDLHYMFSNASITTLVKDNLYCDIHYDMELKRSHMVKDQSSYCTINSRHNCPDFILSFHYRDELPLFAIVVEVKWRSKEKIYSEIDDTDVVVTLKDYLQLGYKDLNEMKLYRSIISQVIVLYPNIEEEMDVLGEQELIGLGILPSNDMKTSFAYKMLSKLILKQIETYI